MDRFGRRVLSLVILADGRRTWRPNLYEEELLGCRVRFDFPVCKLLDLVEAAQRGVEARQPSAVLVVANWLAQQTRGDMEARSQVKWDVTRRLYEAGFGREDIVELYRLIDWLLGLPEGLEREHRQRVRVYEEEKRMPHVTFHIGRVREKSPLRWRLLTCSIAALANTDQRGTRTDR